MNKHETTVKRSVLIDAPMEMVWAGLNQGGLSALHLMRDVPAAKLMEGVSSTWYLLDDPEAAPRWNVRITVCAPPRRLAFMAFLPESGVPDTPENHTLVDITLAPHEDGRTTVTVEHGDFAGQPHAARMARKAGDAWVEALIRWKHRVEQDIAA